MGSRKDFCHAQSLPQAHFCSYLLPALLQSPLSIFAMALGSHFISLVNS